MHSDAINNAILPLAAYKLSGWKTLKRRFGLHGNRKCCNFSTAICCLGCYGCVALTTRSADGFHCFCLFRLFDRKTTFTLFMDGLCVDTIFGEIRAQCLCVPCWTCALASHYSSLYISACQNLLCFRHHAFARSSPSEIVRQFRWRTIVDDMHGD